MNETNSPLEQPPVTQKKPQTFHVIILILILIIVFLLGYIAVNQYSNKTSPDSSTTPATTTSTASPTQTQIQQLPSVAPTIPSTATYSHGTFSFSYPTTWKVFDIQTNPGFFKQNHIDGFGHLIGVEKDDVILLIGIDTYPSGTEVGGLFITGQDFEDFKKNHDEIHIQGNSFYLFKEHISLQSWLDPNRHGGIFGALSLTEYIPNKVTNELGQTYNGWDDYIQNKNGYSYAFIKFSKSNGNNVITPTDIQQDIMKILETIHW